MVLQVSGGYARERYRNRIITKKATNHETQGVIQVEEDHKKVLETADWYTPF